MLGWYRTHGGFWVLLLGSGSEFTLIWVGMEKRSCWDNLAIMSGWDVQ